MEYEKLFCKDLEDMGIELSDKQKYQFGQYYEQIVSWNKKINITSLEDKGEIFKKHFIDSLSIAQYVPLSNQRIIDMGTGGGLPGLALKIAFPELEVTFVDSSKKKMGVLQNIINHLSITGCTIVDNNIENVGRDPKYREKYDIAISRALGHLNIVLELGIPLIHRNGVVILYKGPNVEKEVENSAKALHSLGAKIKKTIDFKLPFSDIQRTFLIVEKYRHTDPKYPRSPGIPKKRPL